MGGRGVRLGGGRKVNLGVGVDFVNSKGMKRVVLGVFHKIARERGFFVGGVVERAEGDGDGGRTTGAAFEVELIERPNVNSEGEKTKIEL